MEARVVSVNISPGGVPKRNVGAALVRIGGVEGDGHNYPSHGGPEKAVCLYTVEAIARVAADGHNAFPGAFGENLTLEGIELGGLASGDRLAIGDGGLLIELTKPTSPCKTIGRFFRAGDFGRISPIDHAEDERWYGRVVAEGTASAGDEVRLVRASQAVGE